MDEQQVALRNSTDPHGPVLMVSASAWRGFIADIKSGRL